MSEVTDFLLKAKSLIDTPEKWIKDTYEKNGCYCAVGALHYVANHIRFNHETWLESSHFLNQVVGQKGFSSITAFNDHPETTHDDVMKIFDLAIEKSKQ